MRENLRNSSIDKKQAEEEPGQNEQCFKLKLDNNLSPSPRAENLELADIIDILDIQPLMDVFYKLTHIPIGLNDLKGNVLVGVGWQDICTKFHRIHPETCKHCVESNIKLSEGALPGKFKMYKCKNNMWEVVTPIMVSGQHVGYVFIGQFFFEDEPLDYELFRSQARQYGFNEDEYIAALERVPRLNREAVDTGMAFFMTFASMLSKLSYSNIKLSQSLEECDVLVDALQESEKRYRMLFDHSMDALILSDPRDGGRILSVNPAACRMLGWSKEELIGRGRDVMFDLEDPAVSDVLQELIRSGSTKAQLTYNRKDGTTFPGEISSVLFMDSNGEPRIVIIIRDITERKKAEKVLKKTHDNLEKLVEERTIQLENAYLLLKENEKSLSEAQKMAHIGSWDFDLVTGKVHLSDEVYRIFGRAPQESSASYEEFLNYVHPDDRNYVDNNIKRNLTGGRCGIDHRVILDNGEERTVHTEREVIFDQNNSLVRSRGIIQDITERKKADEALEKIQEIHIKEIHHRIKNNLQVVSSLLSLEAEKFSDDKVLEAFRESQNRIASMALIHEELYKGNELETLDFAAYLQKLAPDLFDSYNLRNNGIILKLDLEKIPLDMDTAIPLGIIVNELVSNSLKHAFPSGKAGEIHISFCKKENFAANYDIPDPGPYCMGKNELTYILTVADNGKGIPEEIEFPNTNSLGLQLVNLLVEQIDGCIELKKNHGTKFIIWIRNTEI
ncbi:MAG: PocR ligand-binding domain-containing protein [Methanosarcina sp.]